MMMAVKKKRKRKAVTHRLFGYMEERHHTMQLLVCECAVAPPHHLSVYILNVSCHVVFA